MNRMRTFYDVDYSLSTSNSLFPLLYFVMGFKSNLELGIQGTD